MTNQILQLLNKFHQNLMDDSRVIRLNPSQSPLIPLIRLHIEDQFSSYLIHLTVLGIVSIHTQAQKPLVFLILLFSRGLSGLS